MSHPLYVADWAILAALKRIDRGLSIDWVEPGRWAVFHDLPHTGNVDASARALARETFYDYRREGRLVPYEVCLLAAYKLIDQDRLVLVVQEPDGAYRPLDGRVVEHLRRLDWQRRNWWARDYIAVARAQDAELAASQEKAADVMWASLRDDVQGYIDRHHHSFRRIHDSALFPAA